MKTVATGRPEPPSLS